MIFGVKDASVSSSFRKSQRVGIPLVPLPHVKEFIDAVLSGCPGIHM
jgi:hypothetical protein